VAFLQARLRGRGETDGTATANVKDIGEHG
jgi:hypothetical protein